MKYAHARTTEEQLDLKTLDRKQLECAHAQQENIIWECEGRLRVVHFSLWSNAYEILKSYEAMKAAGRIVELPALAGMISWDVARTIFSLPKVDFTFDPAPRRTSGQADPGSVHAPSD